MNLSTHFTLEEMCHSQTADRLGIQNTPDTEQLANLSYTCRGLEFVRAVIGCPVQISSGLRILEVNRAVGSKDDSQHVTGQAADITAPTYGDPKALMNTIIAAKIPFDQCILEYYEPATPSAPARGWVHVSFKRVEPRMQALIIDREGQRRYA